MKTIYMLMFGILCIVWGCGQKAQDGAHHGETPSGNQALYEEVMNVHDEVMPKMDDIYKLKQTLKKQLAESPEISADKKKAIESTIIRLDSAGEGMMVWMRQFNPIPDSLGEEKARQYLMDEKIKITQVKEDILQAIGEAKGLQ